MRADVTYLGVAGIPLAETGCPRLPSIATGKRRVTQVEGSWLPRVSEASQKPSKTYPESTEATSRTQPTALERRIHCLGYGGLHLGYPDTTRDVPGGTQPPPASRHDP